MKITHLPVRYSGVGWVGGRVLEMAPTPPIPVGGFVGFITAWFSQLINYFFQRTALIYIKYRSSLLLLLKKNKTLSNNPLQKPQSFMKNYGSSRFLK
jgi:hypothetical protein